MASNPTPTDGFARWRRLALLFVPVLLVHLLVLKASPAQIGTAFDHDAKQTRSFATRSIEAPLVPQALPATPAPVAPTPAKKTQSIPAPAPQDLTQQAVDSISNNPLQPVPETSAATDTTTTNAQLAASSLQIGRASCRERVCVPV